MSPTIVIDLLILLFSVIVHEIAHGWVALKLGDPTAKNMERLTLNPIPHIDPFLTILLPAVMVLSTGHFFGGAKPVIVEPNNFRNPKRDMALVGAAGPASNLILAILGVIIFKILVSFGLVNQMVHDILISLVIINTVLMAFNLIPLPMLDGSKILMYFLSNRGIEKYNQLSHYGLIIIIAIILLGDLIGTSILGLFIRPFLVVAHNLFY